jgi:hypothetical protein
MMYACIDERMDTHNEVPRTVETDESMQARN